MKRSLPLILVVLLLLTATGCSVLDGEVSVIRPYAAADSLTPDRPEEAPVLNTDEEFRAAVSDMLTAGESSGVFRVPLTGDTEVREQELSDICRELALNTPLGSFAVYYITCKVTPIVSYYSVQVAVTYKRDTEEIDSLFTVPSPRYLDTRLSSLLRDYGQRLCFHTSLDEITDEYITERIDALITGNPLSIVMSPTVDVSSFPSAAGERIMEITLTWPYNAAVLRDMSTRLVDRADEIISRTAYDDDSSLIASFLSEQILPASIQSEAANSLSDSAYGILIGRTGTQKGAALALKALCDRMGIGCYVVTGWHNGEPSYWNIVSCSGTWYHVVPVRPLDDPDPLFLLGNDSMEKAQYFWDASAYPQCPEDYVSSEEAPPPPEEPAVAPTDEGLPEEPGGTDEEAGGEEPEGEPAGEAPAQETQETQETEDVPPADETETEPQAENPADDTNEE